MPQLIATVDRTLSIIGKANIAGALDVSTSFGNVQVAFAIPDESAAEAFAEDNLIHIVTGDGSGDDCRIVNNSGFGLIVQNTDGAVIQDDFLWAGSPSASVEYVPTATLEWDSTSDDAIVFFHNETDLSIYVQFDDDDDTRLSMFEGTGGKTRLYSVTNDDLITAGLAERLYHPSIRLGNPDDPQDDDQILIGLEFNWDGEQEIPVAGTLTVAPGAPLDPGTEPVPSTRTFVFVNTGDAFETEAAMPVPVGGSLTMYACDFRNRCSANQAVHAITSVEVIEGDESGITIDADENWEVARGSNSQFRFQLAGVAIGTYKVRVTVTTLNPGTTLVGDMRIVVYQ